MSLSKMAVLQMHESHNLWFLQIWENNFFHWSLVVFLLISVLDFVSHPYPKYDHRSFNVFWPFWAWVQHYLWWFICSDLIQYIARPSFLHFSAKRKMLENVNSWEEYLHNITKHKFTKEAYLNTAKTGVFTSGQVGDKNIYHIKERKAHHVASET